MNSRLVLKVQEFCRKHWRQVLRWREKLQFREEALHLAARECRRVNVDVEVARAGEDLLKERLRNGAAAARATGRRRRQRRQALRTRTRCCGGTVFADCASTTDRVALVGRRHVDSRARNGRSYGARGASAYRGLVCRSRFAAVWLDDARRSAPGHARRVTRMTTRFRYRASTPEGQVVEEMDWTDQVGGRAGQVVSFGLDSDGEMYVLTVNRLLRVVADRG